MSKRVRAAKRKWIKRAAVFSKLPKEQEGAYLARFRKPHKILEAA